MGRQRIIFFGTPEFAVPTLREIRAAGHDVVAVVTQPDRPRGRGQKPSAGAVKVFAEAHGLPVLQPERLRDEGFLAALAESGARPRGGRRLRQDPARRRARQSPPRADQRPRVAAAAMAGRVADSPRRDGRRRGNRRVDHARRAGARRRRRLRAGSAARLGRMRPARTSSAISRNWARDSSCRSSTRSARARRQKRRRTRRW